MYALFIKIHVPRAHLVKNQRVIAKRNSQIKIPKLGNMDKM